MLPEHPSPHRRAVNLGESEEAVKSRFLIATPRRGGTTEVSARCGLLSGPVNKGGCSRENASSILVRCPRNNVSNNKPCLSVRQRQSTVLPSYWTYLGNSPLQGGRLPNVWIYHYNNPIDSIVRYVSMPLLSPHYEQTKMKCRYSPNTQFYCWPEFPSTHPASPQMTSSLPRSLYHNRNIIFGHVNTVTSAPRKPP